MRDRRPLTKKIGKGSFRILSISIGTIGQGNDTSKILEEDDLYSLSLHQAQLPIQYEGGRETILDKQCHTFPLSLRNHPTER